VKGHSSKVLAFLFGIAAGLVLSGALRHLPKPKPPLPKSDSNEPHRQPTPETPAKPSSAEPPWILYDICSDADSLYWRGFNVARSFNTDKQESTLTIRKGGKTVIRHTVRTIVGPESTCFGLASLLNNHRQQLVIRQNSGGAHCCGRYLIYDYGSNLRLLFDSDNYPLADDASEPELSDIDGDGTLEFTACVSSFFYCCGLSYLGSPMPEVVFKYSNFSKAFIPVTRGFESFLLRNNRADLDLGAPDQSLEIMSAALQHVYAGKEAQGWEIFDEHLRRVPQDRHFKVEIKALLRKDSIYQFIYRHRKQGARLS
jgi:hypothetical protein